MVPKAVRSKISKPTRPVAGSHWAAMSRRSSSMRSDATRTERPLSSSTYGTLAFLSFVTTAAGSTYTRTFAPKEVVVLMINKKVRTRPGLVLGARGSGLGH